MTVCETLVIECAVVYGAQCIRVGIRAVHAALPLYLEALEYTPCTQPEAQQHQQNLELYM